MNATHNTDATHVANSDQLPADIRWTYIREGLSHSLERRNIHIRTGAERRGTTYYMPGYLW